MKDINEQLAGQLGRTVHLDTDRFRGTYFDVIMPLNISAVNAAYDAADAIEETGMFRQSVKREVKKLVKMLSERKIGVLITDHNVRDTLEITDRAIIISQGQVMISGSKQEILYSPLARDIYLGKDFSM